MIKERRLLPLVVFFVILPGFILLLQRHAFEAVENKVFDSFSRTLKISKNPEPSVVTISITEQDLQEIGKWPWPRHYHAALIKILNEWGAEAILFDMFFSEPGDAADDKALVEAIESSGRVYLPVALESSQLGGHWIHSLPEFEKGAAKIGHLNIFPDPDGVVRRIKPVLGNKNETYEYLPLQLAEEGKKLSLPSDADGNLIIHWLGKGGEAFLDYRYGEILKSYEALKNNQTPSVKPSAIRGKICIVGITTARLGSFYAQPLQSRYPSLDIHATVIDNLSHNRFIIPSSHNFNLAILILIGLSFLLFTFLPDALLFTLLPLSGVILSGLWVSIAAYLFWQKGLWVFVVYPLSLIASFYIVLSIIRRVLLEIERQKVREELLKNQLLFLQAQIQPHFLYNAHNTIAYICDQGNAEEAKRLILKLSEFFRMTTKKMEDQVPLKEEVEHVDAYMEIEKARFGDRIRFEKEFDLSESLWMIKIPILIIQPLIENAIKHGISKNKESGLVRLKMFQQNDSLKIQVVDNGAGIHKAAIQDILRGKMQQERNSGIGLYNIHQRLMNLWGKDYGLKFESKHGLGTTVTVTIPLQGDPK